MKCVCCGCPGSDGMIRNDWINQNGPDAHDFNLAFPFCVPILSIISKHSENTFKKT